MNPEKEFPPVRITLSEEHELPAGKWMFYVAGTDGVDMLGFTMLGEMLRIPLNHLSQVEIHKSDHWKTAVSNSGRLLATPADGESRTEQDFGPILGQVDSSIDLDALEARLRGTFGDDAQLAAHDDPEEEAFCPPAFDIALSALE